MIFDIVSYDCFRCVLTDGVNIVAFRPELTTPQHPLDLWIVFENLSCRDALDGLNDIFRGCCGDGLYEKVDVITVRADFDEVDIISLLYSKTDFRERFDHTVGQYFSSILDRTYYVIQQTGFVVTLWDMTVFHSTNILQIPLPPKPQLRSNSSSIQQTHEVSPRGFSRHRRRYKVAYSL